MFKATLLLVVALGTASFIKAQTPPSPPPTPDVLVFSNGDQLSGKVERITGGNVVFKSDMAGELTVGLDKIKELRSGSDASQFALLRKGETPKQMTHAPEGALAYADGNLTITPASAAPVKTKPDDIAYVIDKPTYDKSIAHQAGPLEGWNGSITGGATLVRSTQTATSFTAAAAMVRAIPVVSYLPPRNRTTLNMTETFGKQTSPTIPPPLPASGIPVASIVVTNIFHGDAERDEYFSPNLYVLADAAFDHNYSLGLQFQQIYGGGFGWTPIKTAKQQLDLKADVHYEKQRYFSNDPTLPVAPEANIFGSTFAENYILHLPYKLLLVENGNFLPAWNLMHNYAANITATLTAPVYKRLGISFATTDNYLNSPQPFYKHNSYQYVTGVTYTLH